MIIKNIKKQLGNFDFSIFVFFGYSILFFLYLKTGINLYFLPALLLFFYLPGYYISNFFYFKRQSVEELGEASHFALRVFISFLLFSILGIVLERYFDGNATFGALIVLGVNFSLWFFSRFYFKEKTCLKNVFIIKNYFINKKYFVLLIPLVVLLITVLVNPFAQNADGYLNNLKILIEEGVNYLPSRQIFVNIIALLYYATGINYVLLYRFLFVVLFYISTFFLFDFAKKSIKSSLISNLAYFLFLGAPVILTEVNIIRPQAAMLCLTLPVLILSIHSIAKQSLFYSMGAFLISLVALSFHELSIVLVVTAFLTIVYNLFAKIFLTKNISLKQILVFIVIVLPYFIIFPVMQYFNNALGIIKYAFSFFSKTHWQWWFIGNYTTIDGFNLGWPGLQAIYYYAYNGIPVLLLTVFAGVLFFTKKIQFRLFYLIPIIYTFIFIFFAEIMPRMGLFFLPNRAWPHLMLGLSIIGILLLGNLEKQIMDNKLITVYLISTIFVGILGTVYVSFNNIHSVYSEEKKAINFIKNNTSKESLFISTQENGTLVSFYTNRNYAQINAQKELDKKTFDALIDDVLTDCIRDKTVVLKPEIKEEVKVYKNGGFINEYSRIIQENTTRTIPASCTDDSPVYFVYSYRKTQGVNANRAYLKNIIDFQNKDSYASFDYKIEVKTPTYLILKIR